MTSTFPVSLGQRLLRGLLAALLWTPVLAPIMHLLNNSLMIWLGFAHWPLAHATAVAASVVFMIHATSASQFTTDPDNRVDRILHDPRLGFGAKLSAISQDRLGGALMLYGPLFLAVVCTTRI